MKQQQAHNDERGHSPYEKETAISDRLHDYPPLNITLGAVYNRITAGAIRETLNIDGENS